MAKKNLTVTLYVSELIYDVQNKAWLTGRSRSTGKNHEEVADMQANDDEEDNNQILRSIQNAFGTLKTKLSEYIDDSTTAVTDKLPDGSTNLTLTLQLPSNYNQATADTIASGIHSYIVNTVVGEWFLITDKADAKDYIDLSAANLEQLREAINKRVRPVRTEVQ